MFCSLLWYAIWPKKKNKTILPYLGKEKLVEPSVSSTRGSRWSHGIHNSEAEGDERCCLPCFLYGVHKRRITLLQRKGNKKNLYELISVISKTYVYRWKQVGLAFIFKWGVLNAKTLTTLVEAPSSEPSTHTQAFHYGLNLQFKRLQRMLLASSNIWNHMYNIPTLSLPPLPNIRTHTI